MCFGFLNWSQLNQTNCSWDDSIAGWNINKVIHTILSFYFTAIAANMSLSVHLWPWCDRKDSRSFNAPDDDVIAPCNSQLYRVSIVTSAIGQNSGPGGQSWASSWEQLLQFESLREHERVCSTSKENYWREGNSGPNCLYCESIDQSIHKSAVRCHGRAPPLLGHWLGHCVIHEDMENLLGFTLYANCLSKSFTNFPWQDS